MCTVPRGKPRGALSRGLPEPVPGEGAFLRKNPLNPFNLRLKRDRIDTISSKEPYMTKQHTRRDILKGSLALAGLGLIGLPEWALPALAEGETVVPFTDIPANANFNTNGERRNYDVRKIDGAFTPKDQFFTTQHYPHPQIDPAAFRLKISGLVDKPASLSLDDLKKMKTT